MSFNYPEEIQKMITKNASHSMVGDLGRYQQIEMTDGMASGRIKGGGTAADMAGMLMGVNIANQMKQNMKEQTVTINPNKQTGARQNIPDQAPGMKPNFCPNCGYKVDGANFCPNCGMKLV